jgi:hypothetical protein
MLFWAKGLESILVIFGNFEMAPCCHGNRKVKTEHAVTKALFKSTFVQSLIIIEAVFIVLWQLQLVTGDFSMKTSIFHKMLMRLWVKKRVFTHSN